MDHHTAAGLVPARARACLAAVAAAVALAAGSAARAADAADPFAAHVRPTDPLAPEEERAGFRLPPGFMAELVAAEDRIAKPMNLAFDDRGRLWVSCSVEYPVAAPADRAGRDRIVIIADRDGDGVWEDATTFADGLNVPIGLVPVADGVICFSIPHIWHLRDVDGDDRVDERVVLYGPLGWEKDTHGLCNAFRPGPDGWIHACHGFNNQTRVAGSDGHAVAMQSGNTFRFRPDGRRIEHFTWGQVNPFGMDFDDRGDLFTADCHTKPVTLLLREGRYESFGKPHDGLGFVPPVMDHLHGSTAIGGLAIYDDVRFPPDFRGNGFGGNVMTSRVNRNRLDRVGSSVRAVEQPDLLVATDPWFRPVDLRLGPDGALYVADFYNRIIGHYEVPLDHPGRDRTRGRIWRIRYGGADAAPTPPLESTRLDRLGPEALVAALGDGNRTRRELARERIARGDPAAFVPSLRALLDDSGAASMARGNAAWCLARLGALDGPALARLAAASAAPIREQAQRIAGSGLVVASASVAATQRGLADPDPSVRRAAAGAAAGLPVAVAPASDTLVDPLADAIQAAPAADVHLRHALRIALRARLRDEATLAAAVERSAGGPREPAVADVCLGLDSPLAGDAIVGFLARRPDDGADPATRERDATFIQHAAAHASPAGLARLAEVVRTRHGNDRAFQVALLETVRRSLDRAGRRPAPPIRAWAGAVARDLLELDAAGRPIVRPVALEWTPTALAGGEGDRQPWPEQERRSADGVTAPFRSSLARGERWTGALRSARFPAGPALSFHLAGHDGPPERAPQGRNVVRLRDADTGAVLREAPPPRNDVAQEVRWETASLAGRDVVVEVVDGDDGSAYAWLALGRFSEARLEPDGADRRRQTAATIVAGYGLDELAGALAALVTDVPATAATRGAAAAALNALAPDSRLDALALVFSLPGVSAVQRVEGARMVAARSGDAAAGLVGDLLHRASAADQREIARRLAGDREGCGLLVDAVERSLCPADVLVDPPVRARLDGLGDEPLQTRAARLAAAVADVDAFRARLVAERSAEYRRTGGDAAVGEAVFRRQCASCHQVDGVGAKVGPQLDGVGQRGLDRVVEDVLDPNRNVDVAFRMTTIVTAAGRVVVGLVASDDGAALVCVDQQGKEFSVPTRDIESRTLAPVSLMPANFHETLSPEETRHLFAYLLSLRTPPPTTR